MAPENGRMNGGDAQRREMDELAQREAEVKRREFEALVTKAGLDRDEAEFARLKVQATLIADACCARMEELRGDDGSDTRGRFRSASSNREPSSDRPIRRHI